MRRSSFIVLVLFGSLTAFAQPPMEGRGFERIERFKKLRMVETLNLAEDQSVRFFARHNEFENARRELEKQRNDILDRIERLVRNNADPKEYQKPFAEFAAINRRLEEERQKFFDGLSDLLSVEQQAKLLLFERRFHLELREAIRETQQRRRGRLGEQ